MQLQVDGSILACQLSDDLLEGLVTTSAATMWHLDLSSGQRIPLLSAHAAAVTSLSASPTDAELHASTCEDGALRIWQVSSSDVRPAAACAHCAERKACTCPPAHA